MKKKMEAGLLPSAATVANGPRPRQIDEHQEVKAPFFINMNVIKAREVDSRVEELEEVTTRAQKGQRGIFRVPPSFLPQESEVVKDLQEEVSVLEPGTRKEVDVQEQASSEQGSESSQSSSSNLDTDSMWERESMSSRYETYDGFHVPVEQPYQISCDGESLLAEEVWLDCASDLIEEQVFEDMTCKS
ncbi:hypothetical protein GOP47_0011855 [Adiantum capillus-veneris]|uniref:Uncharacterized protein n=1 Tax=Adiantum capillus-veneris TaxID=13818 RepID=A0A9D4UUV4_ADICA|nr:hypothetical protein GOP47_0011855 [Adiantum capillus-veneris]